MKNKPAISFSWNQARYFDYWSIVHVLTGTVLGFLFLYGDLAPHVSYGAVLVLLILYEVYEYVKGIHEVWPNRIGDVVYGVLGFVIVYEVLFASVEKQNLLVPMIVFIGVALTLSFLGVRAYLHRTDRL